MNYYRNHKVTKNRYLCYSMSNERLSNIELLRILSAFGVLMIHINFPHGFAYSMQAANTGLFGISINALLVNAIEALIIPAVNIFVLISGYFLCTSNNFKSKKVVNLILQVLCFHALYALFNIFVEHDSLDAEKVVSLILPNDYFVSIYVSIYLLSPYINKLLSRLSQDEFKRMLIISGILFSVLPTILDTCHELAGFDLSANNPIGHFGSQMGHTFTQFLLMYSIGAYLRLFPQNKDMTTRRSIYGLIICFLLLFPIITLETVSRVEMLDRTFLAYYNPLIIIEAISIFNIFNNWQFKCKVINFVSPAAFSCYVLGGAIAANLFHWDIFLGNPIIMLLYLFVFCIGAYLIAFVYYFIYSKTVAVAVDCCYNKFGKHKLQ